MARLGLIKMGNGLGLGRNFLVRIGFGLDIGRPKLGLASTWPIGFPMAHWLCVSRALISNLLSMITSPLYSLLHKHGDTVQTPLPLPLLSLVSDEVSTLWRPSMEGSIWRWHVVD